MMKRNILITGCIITMGLISFMLKDFVRENLAAPSIQLVRLFKDLPQSFIWFVFVIFVFTVAYASLNRWKPLQITLRKKEKTVPRGNIEKLADMVKRAEKGGFSKYLYLQYLGELSVQTLACKKKTTPENIRNLIVSDELDIPSDILAYLNYLVQNSSYRYGAPRDARSSNWKKLETLKIEPSRVVRFIEEQLEVFNGNHE